MKASAHLKTIRSESRRPQMTCRDATDLLADYLAEKLNAPERLSFEAHLSGCRDCTAFQATYKRTIELTRSLLASPSLFTTM